MTITADCKDLRTAAAKLAGIARKQQIPILACVHLESRAGRLWLTATDTSQTLSLSVLALDGEISPACVSAEKLAKVAAAASQDVGLSAAAETLTIKHGRSRARLATLPPGDFPLPEAAMSKPIEIDSHALGAAIVFARKAAATGDVRHYLNGVCLSTRDGLMSVVGTDGHRMHVSPVPAPGHQDGDKIFPVECADKAAEMLAAGCRISISDRVVHIGDSVSAFTFRIIEGKYPDWRRVESSHKESEWLYCSRSDLVAAIGAAASVSDGKGAARFEFAPEIRVSAAKCQDDSSSIVDCEYHGDPREIGLAVEYKSDALTAVGTDRVMIGICKSSVIITSGADGDDRRAIVMEARL